MKKTILYFLAVLLVAGCAASRDDQLVSDGFRALLAENYVESEKYFKEALKINPDNAYALLNMGALLQRTGRWQEARPLYRHLMDVGSDVVPKRVSDPRFKGKTLVEIGLENWVRSSGELKEYLRLVPNKSNGEKVYTTFCMNQCHGTQAWGKKDGTYPNIAGRHYNVLLKQLADFRAENRDDPEMIKYSLPSQVGGVQNLVDVSAYLAVLPANPNPGVGPGENLAEAKSLYKQLCQSCHGDKGQGDNRRYHPVIGGEHYQYLVRQYEWIRLGKRRNAIPVKEVHLKTLSRNQIASIMDYASRMSPN